MTNPRCVSRKGKKRTTKQKLNKSLARQSNRSSWWMFHLAFLQSHRKWRRGCFLSLSENISGTGRSEEGEKGRDRGRWTWTSAYVLGKKDAMAGPWRTNWDTEKAWRRPSPVKGYRQGIPVCSEVTMRERQSSSSAMTSLHSWESVYREKRGKGCLLVYKPHDRPLSPTVSFSFFSARLLFTLILFLYYNWDSILFPLISGVQHRS